MIFGSKAAISDIYLAFKKALAGKDFDEAFRDISHPLLNDLRIAWREIINHQENVKRDFLILKEQLAQATSDLEALRMDELKSQLLKQTLCAFNSEIIYIRLSPHAGIASLGSLTWLTPCTIPRLTSARPANLHEFIKLVNPVDQVELLNTLARFEASRSADSEDVKFRIGEDWFSLMLIMAPTIEPYAGGICCSIKSIHDTHNHSLRLEQTRIRFEMATAMLSDGIWDMVISNGDISSPRANFGGLTNTLDYWVSSQQPHLTTRISTG